MRIYLAASYTRKEELRGYRDELVARGHQVTSRWLEEPHDPTVQITDVADEDLAGFAGQDIADIIRSDCFITFADPWYARGGKHVELGFALGLRHSSAYGPRQLIVVGNREHIFHYLPEVEVVPDWATALTRLYWG